MSELELKYMLLNEQAVPPKVMTDDAAGFDLTACTKSWDAMNGVMVYGTGVAMSIPKGYFGLLCARSSVAKKSMMMANGVGIIDPDYRGEIIFKFRVFQKEEWCMQDMMRNTYQVGDRIGQIILVPFAKAAKLAKVDSLDETDRGTGGFGSTGS